MEFHEPVVEFIRIDSNNVISTSCTTVANANPSFQSCSSLSPHEGECEDESSDWVVDWCALNGNSWVDCNDAQSRDVCDDF